MYNTKRTKLIKLVPDLEEILPAKRNVQDIIKQVETRQDFNRIINQMERFMKKGAENMVTTPSGVRTTKYQLNELNIQKRAINLRRAKMRKEADVSTYKGTMGSIRNRNLGELKTDFNKVSKDMWKQIVNKFERQSMDSYYSQRDELYKQNFLTAFNQTYGNMDDGTISKMLQGMNPNDIVQMYYFDPALQIEFLYPEDEEQYQTYFNAFTETLKNYMETLK